MDVYTIQFSKINSYNNLDISCSLRITGLSAAECQTEFKNDSPCLVSQSSQSSLVRQVNVLFLNVLFLNDIDIGLRHTEVGYP